MTASGLARQCGMVLAILASPGCLVLGLDRVYEESAIVFDERLIGEWRDIENDLSLTIERSDWRSYRITYGQTVEQGVISGYLFRLGDDRYLDLFPVRGQDAGVFTLPGHVLVRVALAGLELTATPLSYDWFNAGLSGRLIPESLRASRAERGQIVLGGSSAAIRQWLSGPPERAVFGPMATFRKQQSSTG